MSMNRRNAIALAGVSALGLAAPVAAQTPDADDVEVNKKILSCYVNDVINAGNINAASKYVAPDYQSNTPGNQPGIDALKQRLSDSASARENLITNFKIVIDQLIGEGNTVVLRGHIEGKNKQGSAINALVLTVNEVKNGLLSAGWELEDEATFTQQLNSAPTS